MAQEGGPALPDDQRVLSRERASWPARAVSLVLLAGAAAEIYGLIQSARRHNWVTFGFLLFFVLLTLALAVLMALGWDPDGPVPRTAGQAPGRAADQVPGRAAEQAPAGDTATGPEKAKLIPERIRRTWWWRTALWIWLAVAAGLTVLAVVAGVAGSWQGCVLTAFLALAAWIRLLFRWAGYEPPAPPGIGD